MKTALSILLTILGFKVAAQDLQTDSNLVEVELVMESSSPYPCEWYPPGYQLVNWSAEVLGRSGSGETLLTGAIENNPAAKTLPVPDLSRFANQMIETQEEFDPFSSIVELEIDWKKEKLAFYTNSSCYKSGRLESDYRLSVVSLSPDEKTLHLHYESKFYGVCQGIAQQADWFSYESLSYVFVIPKTVTRITTSSCHYGPDCTNIP